MKNKIICLVLSLVFIAGVFGVGGTYAWFPSYGEGAGGVLHNFKSGNMGYTLTGEFIANTDKIEPLQDLVYQDFYLTNNSGIDTQVRVKVSYTYFVKELDEGKEEYKVVDLSLVSTTDSGAPFVVELAADSDSKTYWTYNDADGYFYYDDPATEGTDDTIQGLAENVTQQIIPLFSAMYYSGEYSDLPTELFALLNDETHQGNFIVSLIFEAKQAAHVEWEVMGTVEHPFEQVPDPTTTVQAS